MIVFRFLVTQLHHARRDQDPDTIKHSQRLDRCPGTYRVGIISIVNNGHEAVLPHLHTMRHRLDPAYRDPQFLQRHAHFMSNCDIYINVVGGLRLDEPASDLSVALALISSLKDAPIRDDVIAFGEVGLGGEIRSVSSCEQRIKESARLGFKRCIVPYHNYKNLNAKIKDIIEIIPARTIRAAFEASI